MRSINFFLSSAKIGFKIFCLHFVLAFEKATHAIQPLNFIIDKRKISNSYVASHKTMSSRIDYINIL